MTEQSAFGREVPRGIELRAARDLEQIPGVLAAAVWIGDHPNVREVYIAAAPGAAATEIRTAAAAALKRHGLACSPDVIQLGSIEEQDAPAVPEQPQDAAPPPTWRGRFLVLASVDLRRTDNTVACRVQVERLGETFHGEARELDTPTGRARAAARATLDAAQAATDGVQLALEGLLTLDLFGRQYVVLSIEAGSARRIAHLSGMVAVDRSIEDAAALATLDAIERWIAW